MLQEQWLELYIETLRKSGLHFRNQMETGPGASRSCWKIPMATRSSYSIRLDGHEFGGADAMSAASAEQQDALKAAADTLSAIPIKTLQFTSSGADLTVGQNFTANILGRVSRPRDM